MGWTDSWTQSEKSKSSRSCRELANRPVVSKIPMLLYGYISNLPKYVSTVLFWYDIEHLAYSQYDLLMIHFSTEPYYILYKI